MNPSEHDSASQPGEAAETDSASRADGAAESAPGDGPGGADAAETAADPALDSDSGPESSETGPDTAGQAPAEPADEELEEVDAVVADPLELLAERDRARDRHLRLAADFDNYRKRTEDRLRQRWDRAQADLVSRLLEPLDDLLRVTALEPETASVEAIVEGVDLVERKFFRLLGEAGVEVVDPEGERFDPNTMEAMMRVPAGSEEQDDIVARVFQRGYTYKGLLVRPARVGVYKA
jgi:molecular chaperone GrpE